LRRKRLRSRPEELRPRAALRACLSENQRRAGKKEEVGQKPHKVQREKGGEGSGATESEFLWKRPGSASLSKRREKEDINGNRKKKNVLMAKEKTEKKNCPQRKGGESSGELPFQTVAKLRKQKTGRTLPPRKKDLYKKKGWNKGRGLKGRDPTRKIARQSPAPKAPSGLVGVPPALEGGVSAEGKTPRKTKSQALAKKKGGHLLSKERGVRSNRELYSTTQLEKVP